MAKNSDILIAQINTSIGQIQNLVQKLLTRYIWDFVAYTTHTFYMSKTKNHFVFVHTIQLSKSLYGKSISLFVIFLFFGKKI